MTVRKSGRISRSVVKWIFSVCLLVVTNVSAAIMTLAEISKPFDPVIVQIVNQQVASTSDFKKLNPADQQALYSGFLKYLTLLKLNTKAHKQQQLLSDITSRLLNSSTQFLVCKPDNWICLEKKPLIKPRQIWRQDTEDNLGHPVNAGDHLDIQAYFTLAWADVGFEIQNLDSQNLNPNDRKTAADAIVNRITQEMRGPERTTVEEVLGDKLVKDADQGLWMAMYGIDDITNSMKDVFNAIVSRKSQNKLTQAVVDVAHESQSNQFLRNYDVIVQQDEQGKNKFTINTLPLNTISFSYVQPANKDYWFFGPAPWQQEIYNIGQIYKSQGKTSNILLTELFKPEEQNKLTNDLIWLMGLNIATQSKVLRSIRSGYQYDGTIDLLKIMNSDLSSNEAAPIHIEWPSKGIMHNKFMVLQSNDGHKSIWAGTANIARTCMGNENNSNMSVYIKNDIIANQYLAEFNEMYLPADHSEKDLVTGNYHTKKRPNTKRYFKFDNGQEVRLHFSPTDDGEHRAILPLLMTAKNGDTLRISMFGGSGLEMVRAMQQAVARGVKIQIVMDYLTGSGATMWAESEVANLLQKNPYTTAPKGSIEVRYSQWYGQNHHKTATLQRAGKNTEYLIVGSQNWSGGGNDVNDENMLTIRHLGNTIDIGDQFNYEFDHKMWPLSKSVGLLKSAIKSRGADNNDSDDSSLN